MAPRVIPPTPPERRPKAGGSSTLEDQLSSVIEQDGIVIAGASAKAYRKKRTQVSARFAGPSMALDVPVAELSMESVAEDHIADLDRQAIGTSVGLAVAKSGAQTRRLKIRSGEHERSPYVVSLQKMLIHRTAPAADERLPVREGSSRMPDVPPQGMPVEVYATMAEDLTGTSGPTYVSDQFTPATFEEAYRAVYGRFDVIRSAVSEARVTIASLFERVERVEQEVERDAGMALGLVEVPRFSPARAMAGFIGLALLVTLPANAVALYHAATEQKDATADAGAQAVQDVLSSKDAGSIPASADALKRASSRFRAADALLSDSSALALGIASVLPEKFRAARALLEVGDKSSEAARLLALGFDKVFSDPGHRIDERLDVLGTYARTAQALLADATRAAATVDPASLPADQRDKVTALFSGLDQATGAVREFSALSDLLSALVGKNESRRYLIVFQNNTELRPTGGFMGSFAEAIVDQGKIASLSVPGGGTYALKGQLLARVAPPKPLQLINGLWQFQDANWSPDFPTAADKIRWFWSKSGQPTIDGVITINASFMEQLLDITGPIDMPEYGKTITKENFLLETQKAVEIEYDKEANTPKKFVGDLAAKALERVQTFGKDDWMKVAELASNALETKDIQVALSRPDEEEIAERYGWSGRLKDTPGDSLALVEANVAGQKTDGSVEEQVVHHAEIADDGSIQDSVTLTRTHTGTKGALFSGVRNVSYLRVYVPKGSTILTADGFQTPPATLFKRVDEDVQQDPDIAAEERGAVDGPHGVSVMAEAGRTVFGGWLQLDPGQTQTITLTYRLPFTTADLLEKVSDAPASAATPRSAYLLLLTSQSGKSSRTITSTVAVPDGQSVAWSRGSTADAGSLGISGTWDRDLVLAALLSPRSSQ